MNRDTAEMIARLTRLGISDNAHASLLRVTHITREAIESAERCHAAEIAELRTKLEG